MPLLPHKSMFNMQNGQFSSLSSFFALGENGWWSLSEDRTKNEIRHDSDFYQTKKEKKKPNNLAFLSCLKVLSQISAEWVKVENACQCSLKATAFCVLAVAAAAASTVQWCSSSVGSRGNQNKELKSFISTSQDFLANAAEARQWKASSLSNL